MKEQIKNLWQGNIKLSKSFWLYGVVPLILILCLSAIIRLTMLYYFSFMLISPFSTPYVLFLYFIEALFHAYFLFISICIWKRKITSNAGNMVIRAMIVLYWVFTSYDVYLFNKEVTDVDDLFRITMPRILDYDPTIKYPESMRHF